MHEHRNNSRSVNKLTVEATELFYNRPFFFWIDFKMDIKKNVFYKLLCKYPVLLCICPVQPVCTFLFILLFIKSTVYCPAHFILFFFFSLYQYLCIFSCVCIAYNCTVHAVDLTYISLLVIFCITVCVTNTNLASLKFRTL